MTVENELLKEILGALIAMWIWINTISCIFYLVEHERCLLPVKRIEILFPGSLAGCWLKDPVYESKKHDV